MNESTISEENHQKNEYLPYNIQSYEDSLAYTKKLILIAISTISYLRSILPEEVFSTKEVEKMKFKIVRSKNNDSHTLINWIKGAFDAIEKKYLSTISLAIYTDPKNPQLVLETYDFHLSYGENVNLQISKNFSQKIKLTSLRVLRTIVATISSLEDLPLKLSMNMRLIYNENVPDEYEPPGFKACNFEKYRYDQGKCRIRIGDVNCLWHQVNIEINCSNKMLKKDEFNENMDTSEVSKKDLSETVELVPINISTEIKPENKLNEVENHEDTITSKIGELQVNSSIVSSPPEIRSIEKIECICNSEQQDEMKLIRCSNCKTFQHAVCYNIFCSEKDNGTLWGKEFVHCCINCYHKDPKLKTTDKSLVKMDKKKLIGISLWRKALYEIKKIDTDQFSSKDLMEILSLKQNIMKGLIKKLEDENILKCSNKKDGIYNILYSNLTNYIKKNCIDPTRKLKEEDLKGNIDENGSSALSELSCNSKFDFDKNQKRQINSADYFLQTVKKIKTSISNESIDQI